MKNHQIKTNKQKTAADLQTLYLTLAGCVWKQRPGASDWNHFTLALRPVMIRRCSLLTNNLKLRTESRKRTCTFWKRRATLHKNIANLLIYRDKLLLGTAICCYSAGSFTPLVVVPSHCWVWTLNILCVLYYISQLAFWNLLCFQIEN